MPTVYFIAGEFAMNITAAEPAPTISVVVPVYRSEGTLRELHRRLVGVLAPQGASFEIIFVEDCGGDESWQVIEDLGRRDTRVRGFVSAGTSVSTTRSFAASARLGIRWW